MRKVSLAGAAAVLFTALLVLPSFLSLLLPDRYVSERERRGLQQRPTFSAAGLLSGRYMQELETYFSDQLPLRDGLASLNAGLSFCLGQREFASFYVGDGRLLQAQRGLNQEDMEKNLSYVEALAASLDVPVTLALAPGSAEIYPEALPYGGMEDDLSPLYDSAKGRAFSLLDLRPALLAHKNEDIYFKTDHHWTSLGAAYAWAAYAEQNGIDALPLGEYEERPLSDTFYGTGWAAVGLPGLPADTLFSYDGGQPLKLTQNGDEKERDGLLFEEHLNSADPYAVYLNGNQPLITIQGGAANGRRLLIVKDSFANCLAQFAATDVERVDLIDLRAFRGDVASYAREMGATELLVLYNIKNFCEDKNLYLLKKGS